MIILKERDYYLEELKKIREEAREFSRINPSLAPALAGASFDPDVERILEGVSYLTAQIQKKLGDGQPEIIQSLAYTLFPTLIRPIPSMSLVTFRHKYPTSFKVTVPALTNVETKSEDTIPCKFRTTDDLSLLPLKMHDLQWTERNDGKCELLLELNVTCEHPEKQMENYIDFHINADFIRSCDFLLVMLTCVENIEIFFNTKEKVVLPENSVQFAGNFSSMLPRSDHACEEFLPLLEYSLLPTKFLKFRVQNINFKKFSKTSGNLFLKFKFSTFPKGLQTKITVEDLFLNTVPVINLFKAESAAITSLENHYEHTLSVHNMPAESYSIYDVLSVIGVLKNQEAELKFHRFESFPILADQAAPTYQLRSYTDKVHDKDALNISFAYRSIEQLAQIDFINAEFICTNGKETNFIAPNEIIEHSDNTPEKVVFSNIVSASIHIPALSSEFHLWNFLSYAHSLKLDINKPDLLKKVLFNYLVPPHIENEYTKKNQRSLDGIQSIEFSNVQMVHRCRFIMGQRLLLIVDKSCYASLGDLYLFVSVLFEFFKIRTEINAFLEMQVQEIKSGVLWTWKSKNQ